MELTIFSKNLAREIVKSWSVRRSNYIIVAPPMSDGRALLHEVCNIDFIRDVLKNSSVNVAVAELDTSDFRDGLTFAKGVLKQWNVADLNDVDLDPVSMLNGGVKKLSRLSIIPVIVIHRFHEALQKLGEEIGTALRNLEHDCNLKTVVELPISIASLRERWNVLDLDSPPFLASDWGQGHSVKFLKGYSVQEISNLLPDSINDGMAKKIFHLTGGMVGLVAHLIEPANERNPISLEMYAKSQSSRLCNRLLKWIDKPNDDFYKKLVVKTLGNSLAKTGVTTIADHDWRDLLVNKDGTTNCLMLAWACAEQVEKFARPWFLNELIECFVNNRFEELGRISNGMKEDDVVTIEKKRALVLVCRLSAVTNPFVDKWNEAREILAEFSAIKQSSRCPDIDRAWSEMLPWLSLCEHMCDFQYAKNINENIRLEEFSLSSKKEESVLSLLQLLQLRLDYALKLSPYIALKSVVEQPEAMLQIYAYLKANVRYWKFDGISMEDTEKIQTLIKKPFRAPKKNDQLGFIEILYITFLRMEEIPFVDKLFSTYTDVVNIEKMYEERKRQVHSTAFVSNSDWCDYEIFCRKWMTILHACVLNGRAPELPTPYRIFTTLVSSMNFTV